MISISSSEAFLPVQIANFWLNLGTDRTAFNMNCNVPSQQQVWHPYWLGFQCERQKCILHHLIESNTWQYLILNRKNNNFFNCQHNKTDRSEIDVGSCWCCTGYILYWAMYVVSATSGKWFFLAHITCFVVAIISGLDVWSHAQVTLFRQIIKCFLGFAFMFCKHASFASNVLLLY